MKFKIIGIHERIYKKISFFAVVGITVECIVTYLRLEDKSDTFIMATLYALLLFVIGIYITYMENKIDEKFYDRKDYYLNLCKLKATFEHNDLNSFSDTTVFSTIISFQVLTSRTDGMKNEKPYIQELGIKFDNDELQVEKEFIQKRNGLIDKFRNGINDYISLNSIETTVRYPSINDIYEFDVKSWCKEYCKLNDKQIEDMEIYIFNIFSELKDELDELELIMNKVTNLYRGYLNSAKWNIKAIEKTYGKRLDYVIDRENQFIAEIQSLRTLTEKLYNNMCSYEEYRELSHDIKECRLDINALSEKIEMVETNICSEIDLVINTRI